MANDPCLRDTESAATNVEGGKLGVDVLLSPDPGNLVEQRGNGLYAFGVDPSSANLLVRLAGGLRVSNPYLGGYLVQAASGGALNQDPGTPGARVFGGAVTLDVGPFDVSSHIWVNVQISGYFNPGRPDGSNTGWNEKIGHYVHLIQQNFVNGVLEVQGEDYSFGVQFIPSFYGQTAESRDWRSVAVVPPGRVARFTAQHAIDTFTAGPYYHRFGTPRITAQAFRAPGS